ncbi:MAG: hypothetical protein ABJL11_03710 [Parasphingorhabdus sp.]
MLFNREKYVGFDQYEIISDGMTFDLKLFSEAETQNMLQQNSVTTLFNSAAKHNSKSIGIWLGDHLKSGKHLPSINRALIRIAKLLGQSVSATHLGWLPAQQSIDFEHFEESADDYLTGGPTPILFQIAIIKSGDRTMKTRGLSYFSDQEVTLRTAPNMNESEAIKRLVRICHDITINGKIEQKIVVDGLVEGEKITLEPTSNLTNVTVSIS